MFISFRMIHLWLKLMIKQTCIREKKNTLLPNIGHELLLVSSAPGNWKRMNYTCTTCNKTVYICIFILVTAHFYSTLILTLRANRENSSSPTRLTFWTDTFIYLFICLLRKKCMCTVWFYILYVHIHWRKRDAWNEAEAWDKRVVW